MEILSTLEAFFRHEAPLASGDRLIAAFSGGPDSTALLLGLARLAERRRCPLVAAHLDHAMDPGSAERAEAARRLAERLEVPFTTARREVLRQRRPGESPEAAARRVRYDYLEEVRNSSGARWIATAHHRDDQAETVALRLFFGSGLEGLGGIRPVQGAVVRPLLGVARRVLLEALAAAGVEPVQDPTNLDLRGPRNRVRQLLTPCPSPAFGRPLPSPRTGGEELRAHLARLADRSRAASARIDRYLSGSLDVEEKEDGVAVERSRLFRLPAEVLPFALAWLHRRAGAPYPAGSAARAELLRQLEERDSAGCDCGGGWRWQAGGTLLMLRRPAAEETRMASFSYILAAPGQVEIPEIGARIGVCRRPVEPWMFQGSPCRAALALPFTEGGRLTVRSRRPGDRLQPLGAAGSRKLKDLLIDRRMPRHERDRLPLICVGERIAWVPGITIDQRFRISGESAAWIASLAPAAPEEESEITEVTT